MNENNLKERNKAYKKRMEIVIGELRDILLDINSVHLLGWPGRQHCSYILNSIYTIMKLLKKHKAKEEGYTTLLSTDRDLQAAFNLIDKEFKKIEGILLQ